VSEARKCKKDFCFLSKFVSFQVDDKAVSPATTGEYRYGKLTRAESNVFLELLDETKPQHQVGIKLLNMGKVMSIIVGKVQRFNVENRTHKLITQDKTRSAPKYEANVKDISVCSLFTSLLNQAKPGNLMTFS
jgi:Uncharacterised protein family (UPF0240)